MAAVAPMTSEIRKRRWGQYGARASSMDHDIGPAASSAISHEREKRRDDVSTDFAAMIAAGRSAPQGSDQDRPGFPCGGWLGVPAAMGRSKIVLRFNQCHQPGRRKTFNLQQSV